jgi:ribose transport system substrate-binding protein
VKARSLALILAAGVLAVAVLTAMYRGTAFFGDKSREKPRVVVVFKMVDFDVNAFWRTVRDGAVSAAQDFGVDVSVRGPWVETSVEEQIAIVRKAILEKPKAIVLAAGDYNLLVPVAAEARKSGIPLVCIDSFINSKDSEVNIGTDNYEAGQKCGEALLRYIEPGSLVAVVSYIKGSSTAIDRERGVRKSLEGKAVLLDTVYSNSETDTAYREAKEILARNPGLAGIVALNEPTSSGVARALSEASDRERVKLACFDNSFGVLKFVERGIIKDTIVQKPFNMGYLGVKAAFDILSGKKPPAYINTGSVDVNRANMFQPENQKLLFPVAGGP